MNLLKYSIVILLLTLLSCKKEAHTHSEEEHQHTKNESSEHEENIVLTTAQFTANAMQLGTITTQDFSKLIKTTGMIDVPPQNKEIISAISGGYIRKSNLLIGDKVKKGQALVTIENPDFVSLQQEYLEAVTQVSYLKLEYERQKTLFDEKITSQKNYLKAKSEYNRNQAIYSGLRKKLRMLNINPSRVERGNITSIITLYASISGSVTQLNVSIGTYVSAQDVIMEIVNTKHIHLELTVFEKDIMKIKEDQKIKFTIPEASNETYEAEVHLVGTSINQTTRTVKVHGHLHTDKNHNFAVGMFVDAAIETATKKVQTLPEAAILENEDHFVVLVLTAQKNKKYIFETKEVTVGETQNGFTEITSTNIKPTDKVLIKGGYSLVGAEGGGHSH